MNTPRSLGVVIVAVSILSVPPVREIRLMPRPVALVEVIESKPRPVAPMVTLPIKRPLPEVATAVLPEPVTVREPPVLMKKAVPVLVVTVLLFKITG